MYSLFVTVTWVCAILAAVSGLIYIIEIIAKKSVKLQSNDAFRGAAVDAHQIFAPTFCFVAVGSIMYFMLSDWQLTRGTVCFASFLLATAALVKARRLTCPAAVQARDQMRRLKVDSEQRTFAKWEEDQAVWRTQQRDPGAS